MIKRGISSLAVLLAALGCSPETMEISDTRVVDSPQVDTSVTGRDRFGMRSMAAARPGAGPLAYDLPEGWHAEAPTDLRVINLHAGSSHDVECYVTVLEGDGGGVEANFNRWRRQMGQEALTSEEVAALPRLPVLGAEAAYITIPGAYQGMQGEVSIDDAVMLGVMAVLGRQSVFVKMVGPAEAVEQERPQFEAFCRSLRPAGGESAQSAVQGPEAGDTASPAAAGVFDPASLTWTAPDHWTRGRESSMRLMTYLMGPEQDAECVVSVFPGDVGGLVANVNRWRGQMGLEDQGAEAVDALPVIETLGQNATLVELEGAYSGMDDEPQNDYALLGVIVPAQSHTLFFKLTGPAEVVSAEKQNFLEFVQSFEQ